MEEQALAHSADSLHTLSHEANPDVMLHLLNETTGAELCIAAEELCTNTVEASLKVQDIVQRHIAVSGKEKQSIINRMANQRPYNETRCLVGAQRVVYETQHKDMKKMFS